MANNRGRPNKRRKIGNHEQCGSLVVAYHVKMMVTKALGCEGYCYCRRWFHVQCVDVETLNLTFTLGDEVKWLCNLCDKRFDEAVLNRQNEFTDMDMSNGSNSTG